MATSVEPLWDDENITLFLKELRETCERAVEGKLYERSREENYLLREKNLLLTENDKLQTETIRLLEDVNKKLEKKTIYYLEKSEKLREERDSNF